VYIRRSKAISSTLLPVNLVPTAADLAPIPNHAHVTTDPPPPTVKLDLSPFSDLDLPIALCKGKQSSTMHLISNFVSYNHLTPLSHKFAISISYISVLKSYQDAVMYPEWKQFMDEEMDILLSY